MFPRVISIGTKLFLDLYSLLFPRDHWCRSHERNDSSFIPSLSGLCPIVLGSMHAIVAFGAREIIASYTHTDVNKFSNIDCWREVTSTRNHPRGRFLPSTHCFHNFHWIPVIIRVISITANLLPIMFMKKLISNLRQRKFFSKPAHGFIANSLIHGPANTFWSG